VLQRKPGALRNGAPFTELPDGWRVIGVATMADSGITVDGKPFSREGGWAHWR